MVELKITLDDAAAREALAALDSPETRRLVTEAAGAEVRNGAIEHFHTRAAEPENTAGFPKFGQAWGKTGFWAGTRGVSVAEQVGPARYDEADDSVTIEIDSPALAHKANPNPPPIRPTGGRQRLAIPANARAAHFPAMPRDFPGVEFGYAQTPEGRPMPALITRRQGQAAEPVYWLVRVVQTRHDPRAMPNQADLHQRANTRAAELLNRLARRIQEPATA